MIEGKKKEDYIDVRELMPFTSNGKDIYTKYLGIKIGRSAIKRPWGEDNHPSWGVWQAPDGMWMWKDIAREEAGNAIQFVQKLFNLSHSDAVKKICFDFGISGEDIKAERVYSPSVQKAQIRDYTHITCKVKKFGPRHHAFWNSVEVTEDWCKKFNCYAVKELAINHKKMPIGEHEVVFVYLADDLNKVKVYFPDREQSDRFRNNVPYHYIWNHKNVNTCDKLVIHKSMKDLITFAQLHDGNVATQNESVNVFSSDVTASLSAMSKNIWLFYGSDRDGMEKSDKIVKATGWNKIHTPTAMLPVINDVYSYVKVHGLKALEALCQLKHLL